MSETNNTARNAGVITVAPGFSSISTKFDNEEIGAEEKEIKRELKQDCCAELCEPCCTLCGEMLQIWCCLNFWSDLFGTIGTNDCCCCCEAGCDCCSGGCCDGCDGCCDDCGGCCDGCDGCFS